MNKTDKTDLSAVGVLGSVILAAFLVICLIPNGPKIKNTFHAEAETKFVDQITAPPETEIVRRSLGFFTVTAYCPCELCCGEWSDGVTASGHVIRPGDRFVAADPAIPFGAVLDVPGYGAVPVLDRGGAIRGRKLDVFFHTHAEALEWGVRELEIHCWVQGD